MRFTYRRPDKKNGLPPLVVLVAHMTSGPDLAEHAKSRGVALYRSYDFTN